MQSKDFRLSSHAEPPRVRLTSPWTLVGIALAVGVILVLIFPGGGIVPSSLTTGVGGTTTREPGVFGGRGRDMEPGTTAGGGAPGVATAPPVAGQAGAPAGQAGAPTAQPASELELRLQKEPGNADLRFQVARERTDKGRIAEARAALEPLYNSPDPAVRQQARMSDIKLQLQQMYAHQPGSPERQREAERLRQEIIAMSQYEWDSAGLRELAEVANQVGAQGVRAQLYGRLARADPNLGPEGIDHAAQALVASGNYAAAADIYFSAQSRATTLQARRAYFTAGVKALQAGNMPRQALVAAERNLGTLANDESTLEYMVRLARAANDLDRAQYYAKRLLKMTQNGLVLEWMRAVADLLVPSAVAAEPVPQPAPIGMRPFDAEDYALAYDVFVAARNLGDAYRVARAAVLQRPTNMEWRQRLARVAEWSGKTGEALEHWLFLARRTGSGEAWQAVLRVAPGLADDEVLLEAMRYQAGKTQLTDSQWQAIAAAYVRVGRPKEGIEFLEQEYRRRPRPAILESLAFLYERSGDIPGAIAAYRRLIEQSGPTTERVTTLSTLLIARGDYREAYDLLQTHRRRAPADDVEYLRLLGDLALRLREDEAAQVTYERLVASSKATLDDFVRLVNLLAPRQPEAAARLAETAYRRFNSPDMLLTALGLHSQRRDFEAMSRLFASMPPEMERKLEGNPGFLLLRADYRNATGSPDLALLDYREALRIDPQNRFARSGLLYFLIDRRRLDELRRELPPAVQLAKTDPEFQGVVGAAYLALDEPQRALPYFAEQVKRNPNDYLWLLNYADALDRNLQRDMAWRVRRQAWFELRKQADSKEISERQAVLAQARLVGQFFPGDSGLAVIRNVLRQDADADKISEDPHQKPIDAATRELVLAWAISSEQYITAKAWLWTQYARSLAAPPWAEVNVALAHNDLDTLQKALEEYPDAIPRYDRHEAARRTQQYRYAQSIAFTELEKFPYDDEMHLRLTQSAFDMVSHTRVGYNTFTRGPIGGHEWTGEFAVWLSPRLRMSVDVSHIDQGVTNYAALGFVPPTDRLYGVTALWRHSVGETRFTLWHREGLAEHNGLRIVHQQPLGPRVLGRIGLGLNERTLETAALAAGGARDQIALDAQYTLSKREYLIGQLFANRYYTQTERTKIGSSYGLNWEAGHRFRTEYPDWHVRLAGSFNHFTRNGSGDAGTAVLTPTGTVPTADFFLPPSFSNVGLYTGFGTYYQNNYTRALRPYVDVGLVHNSVTGNGYSALVGLAGSVVGADHFTLYASTGRGGSGVNERSREVGLRYMYLFDNF